MLFKNRIFISLKNSWNSWNLQRCNRSILLPRIEFSYDSGYSKVYISEDIIKFSDVYDFLFPWESSWVHTFSVRFKSGKLASKLTFHWFSPKQFWVDLGECDFEPFFWNTNQDRWSSVSNGQNSCTGMFWYFKLSIIPLMKIKGVCGNFEFGLFFG